MELFPRNCYFSNEKNLFFPGNTGPSEKNKHTWKLRDSTPHVSAKTTRRLIKVNVIEKMFDGDEEDAEADDAAELEELEEIEEGIFLCVYVSEKSLLSDSSLPPIVKRVFGELFWKKKKGGKMCY